MPPLPAFYLKPKTIGEMVDHTVSRVLDFWGIAMPGVKRWE
jgi:4-hydroxy-3-polyprenylbenzoate decarboxylase